MSNKEVFKRFGEGFSNNLDSLLAAGPQKIKKKELNTENELDNNNQEFIENHQESNSNKVNEEGSVLESVVAGRPKPTNRRRPTNVRGMATQIKEKNEIEAHNDENNEEKKKVQEAEEEQSIYSKLFWNMVYLISFPLTIPYKLYRKYTE